MRMVAHYSHLNGLEYLLVHKSGLWKEIEEVISSVDAEQCRIKVSGEKRMMGKMLYSPRAMNKAVKRGFEIREWVESKTSYWVTKDASPKCRPVWAITSESFTT